MFYTLQGILFTGDSYRVKPVLIGNPRDPLPCPLNRGIRLVQVHVKENKGRKLVFTEAGVCLMQGVRLIWGPLNTGFTVISFTVHLFS